MKGWVYVISNKAMLGLIKVGYSTKDPELRAEELNHTGSPHPYVVEYEMLIEEPYEIEQKTHKLLSSKLEAKEWFRCSAEEAVAGIKQVSGNRIITETYKRAEKAKAEALHQRKLEEEEVNSQRRKAEQAFEDCLRNEEAIIHEKFEQQIAASFPPRPFWNYWLAGGILVVIGLGSFNPKISYGAGFMLSAILGALAGWGLQEYWENKRKQSSAYIALGKHRDEELAAAQQECLESRRKLSSACIAPEKQRNEELTAVRMREQAEPSQQAVAPINDRLLAQLERQADFGGDASAQCRLGDMFYYGKGVPRDASKAVFWWQKAATQGHASIQFVLGRLYEEGKDVPKDDAKAVEWYRKAAVQGYTWAQARLGWMYLNGMGVPQSDTEAVAWFRKAAEQGDARGQNNLGVMYRDGRGVPQSDTEAVAWLRKAAEKGNGLGQLNLGWMYMNGRGVPQSDTDAFAWYRKAAEKGNAQGQRNLSWMYNKGRGVPQSYIEAAKWERKAAEQENTNG